MNSSAEGQNEKTIDDLPDEVLEYILSLVSPYKDSDSCQLVCKRWCRTVNSVRHHSKYDLCKSVLNANVHWQCLVPSNLDTTIITKRFSHAACYCDSFMYVFGGCTSRCTTFNDLWTLDLNKRIWMRPFTTGSYPSPKAGATLCCYNKNLILFGGWADPPSYPLHQTLLLFNELHIYSITSNKWTAKYLLPCPPPMAEHSATIHRNLMVVFGGFHSGEAMFHLRSSNFIWCYNLETESWTQPQTSNPKPKARYGQSQIFLDDENILIIGGCEGPNSILDDVWLLTITQPIWIWKKIKVKNPQWAAPYLWCHPACRVGDAVVIFSRGTQQVSHYSLNSTTDIEIPLNDASIPPEVVARVTSQGQIPYIKDKNVNGQRGSLGKINRSHAEPSTSSSSNRENESSTMNNDPGTSNFIHIHQEPEPHSSSRLNSDIQMAAFRDQKTYPRAGNFSKNRLKQLECLRRMEEKYKNLNKEKDLKRKSPDGNGSNEPDPAPGPSGAGGSGNRMTMYVMDISEVLTPKACVTWKPARLCPKAPREKMLHSLVLGKGELIMFGGVQNNPTAAFPVSSYMCVTNSTHIITAPRNIV